MASWLFLKLPNSGIHRVKHHHDVLRRHFHHWNDTSDRKHFVYSPHHVEVAVRLTLPPSAEGAQNNLIQRLLPRDNTNGYELDPF